MKAFRCACVASVALRLPAAYHFGTGSGKGRKGQVWGEGGAGRGRWGSGRNESGRRTLEQ